MRAVGEFFRHSATPARSTDAEFEQQKAKILGS
jgi:hypothetical protein